MNSQRARPTAVRTPRKNAKPTAVISTPKRLSGPPPPGEQAGADERPAEEQPEHGGHAARRRRGRTRARSRGRRARRRCPRSRRAPSARRSPVTGPSSSCTRSPESSALGTNPHAPDVVTSGPKSEPSRLEVMITVGCSAYAVIRCADVEAVDVGQLDVEQHHLGPQPAALVQRRRAVDRLADDLEPLGLEHHPRAGPKGRVVVDDEDPVAHELVNDCGAAQMRRPYGWPHSAYRAAAATVGRQRQGLRPRRPPSPPRTRSRRPRAHGPAVSRVDPAVDLERRPVADQRAQALELGQRARQERAGRPSPG